MSHQTQIDYQHIATQCKSVCELAEKQLAEMDKLLQEMKNNSSSILNEQAEAFKISVQEEQRKLQLNIDKVRAAAEVQAKKGTVTVDNEKEEYRHRNDAIAAAEALKAQVDKLASSKLVEFQGLLETLLKTSIEENNRRLLEKSNGIVTASSSVQRLLDGITDAMLKQFTYLAYLQDPTLSGDDLLAAGRRLSEETYESRYEREVEKIRAELQAAKVEKEEIEKITAKKDDSKRESLVAMREAASKEIVDEKVRRQALKVITQAIRARGFIVDKNNIKIKKETNEVVMVALKASGEKAEFRIFLDGKFIYHFHGYEGQACQKDIEPFMQDLEEVYGIHVIKQTEIWSNPDKISTMKYQAINTNKNRR